MQTVIDLCELPNPRIIRTFASRMEKVKKNIRHLTYDEIEAFFDTLGEKKFRAKQVYEWLWQKHAHSFEDMTNLSKPLRQHLAGTFTFPALSIDATQYSNDGTIKDRFRTA